MKNHPAVRLLFTASAVLLGMTSCDAPMGTAVMRETVTWEMQPDIRLFASIDDCMENADYVITCTVADIGEPFAKDGPHKPETQGRALYDYIRSIRTPVTLAVEEVHYDSTGTLGDTLTVLEYRGTVNGCTLTNPFPDYEEGHRYLLFIAIAPDGETNIIIGQASVELPADDASAFSLPADESDSFTPMFQNHAFDDYDSLSELTDAVRAYRRTDE